MRYLIFCATLSILLLSALVPPQAQASSACPSSPAVAVEDICLAPGVAPSPRASAKKPCFTCAFPETVMLPERPAAIVSVVLIATGSDLPGRVVAPDRRPPRA